jgi:hypothetical protein
VNRLGPVFLALAATGHLLGAGAGEQPVAITPTGINGVINVLGIVRLNSILRSGAPGRGRAPLFLLMNRQRAGRDSTPKTAYTDLP